jgi:hypothetical protein
MVHLFGQESTQPLARETRQAEHNGIHNISLAAIVSYIPLRVPLSQLVKRGIVWEGQG